MVKMDAFINVRCSQRTKQHVQQVAGSDSVATFSREAIIEKLRRPSSWGSHRFAEVQLEPRVNGGSVDSMLEILAAQSPTVSDFVCGDGELDPQLRIALRKSLAPAQSRRIELLLTGERLESIGLMEGCSKQAVWASIQRAIRRLERNVYFLQTLCSLFQDSGLDPRLLMEAVHGKDYQRS